MFWSQVVFWTWCAVSIVVAVIEKEEDEDGHGDKGSGDSIPDSFRHTSDLPLRRVRG